MRGCLAAFLSVLSVAALAPAPAAGEDACPSDFYLMQDLPTPWPVHASAGTAVLADASSGCALLLPSTQTVYATWAPGVAGERGLAVRVEGEGVAPFELPVAETSGTDALGRPYLRYETASFPVPDGLQGALRATLLQEGVPLRTTSLAPAA